MEYRKEFLCFPFPIHAEKCNIRIATMQKDGLEELLQLLYKLPGTLVKE